MGRVKDLIIEIEERGFSLGLNKNVCADMFPHQKLIRDMIGKIGKNGVCDYSKKNTLVVDVGDVTKKVYHEFTQYYEDPANNISFESHGTWDDLDGSGLHKEGGGYILPNRRRIMTTEEALSDAGFCPQCDELFYDIANSFNTNAWVLKDAIAPTDEESLRYDWEAFWKHTIEDFRMGVAYNAIRNKYAQLLDFLQDKISENISSLTIQLKAGSHLYRSVNYKYVPNPMKPKDLWAPPVKYATSQRMSRDEQSRFYASFDKETPISEAVVNGADEHHCLGDFTLKQTISVLDFYDIPEPNILNVPDFVAYRYFEDFANAITKDVREDKAQYVPTQLMRDIIEAAFCGIMGIKYRSVQNKGKANLVLFLDNNTCADYLDLVQYEVM